MLNQQDTRLPRRLSWLFTKPTNLETIEVTGGALSRFDRIIRTVALWGGGAMLLGLVFLTVTDVILRYVFNAPLFGARDIGKLMLLSLVALSPAYSARTGGQVAIEVFSTFLGERLVRLLEIAVRIAAVIMLSILAWRLIIGGLNAGRFGEASLSLGIPYAPFYLLFSCGMLLYVAVLVVETVLLLCGRNTEANIDDWSGQ